MPTSHHINRSLHIGCLESTESGSLDDLERAIAGLVDESEFDASFGVLLELRGGAALLAPTRALRVAELFARRREHVQGPVAVCIAGMQEYATGRLIAMLGRHYGLWMEAFRDRQSALSWLAECMRSH